MGTNKIFLLLLGNTVLAQTNKTCGKHYWPCGDQCISTDDDCLCGDRRISWDDPRWCCNSGPCEGNSYRYATNRWIGASCPGTVQSLDTPCNGSCSKDKEVIVLFGLSLTTTPVKIFLGILFSF